jgi:hypothetical protein
MKNIIDSDNVSIEDWNSQDFPVTKYTVIDGLSKTLTKLLSYKISQEAYQRYSVRLQLIASLNPLFYNLFIAFINIKLSKFIILML